MPIRAYALCIIAGIVARRAVVTERRLRSRGVAPRRVLDIAVWAVPFGIVGARIYHVITSPEQYFGEGGDPMQGVRHLGGRPRHLGRGRGRRASAPGSPARQPACRCRVFADALAPGLPVAQAIGRFGNWFNNELYGGADRPCRGACRCTEMDRRPRARARSSTASRSRCPGLFHPTFLYEAIWDLGVALLVVIWLDRRFKFGRGRAFALYVMAYTVGRFWIEMLRIDEANHILGMRLNDWTSILVFLGALIYFVRVRGPQEYCADRPGATPSRPPVDLSQVDRRSGETRAGTPRRRATGW